ncbi:alpha-ketoglutarate-dependent dioxygenase AlkB [Synechococcus sp. CS-1325]|uniref:alpha-ketoglutarate-dependent dioxygenase AlkB family protein n=1 Tax=Synechococcus sp. CS-1325 TaxID=2847979 RepID=UPI000DB8D941|nr:alpha-ketoglutarate-dependent dioxygenase AlkB [Synechococcus sp. CS-1325]MCT0198261.1 alpha-ketoglutarate-dependent dioxygenase AlkB [Synechococcus sp. CS-1325]PZU96984.1 MAG: alpha-ketoglutarate-dependent dioxygenase AlkB [Cyanobium sp.]
MSRQLDLLAPEPVPSGEVEHVVRADGLVVRHRPGWLAEADHHLSALLQEVPWKQEQITLFGRTHPIPRLTCWMGDPGCHYTYSGVRNAIEAWTPGLQALREQVEAEAGCPFNSLLLNRYRNGNDRLGWHADDEPELDPDRPIASLSLGASRSFRLRPRHPAVNGTAAFSLELGHGDLLIMEPPTQRHWLHQLPRRRRVIQERLNLTFRVIGTRPLKPPLS